MSDNGWIIMCEEKRETEREREKPCLAAVCPIFECLIWLSLHKVWLFMNVITAF